MKNIVKISIITVCFNSLNYIEYCIKSVISQTYNNIEYIIIDGGSDDGTKDIIQKYDYVIDRWISEKDSGISEAMNKGLSFCSGDYILFLHSDDYLLSTDSIKNAVNSMELNYDINAFSVLYGNETKYFKKNSKPFSFKTFFKTPIMHQGAFCKQSIFEKIGLFDESFKITMDYDFFLRAYLSGCSLNCMSDPISFMRDTGISSKKEWNNLKTRFFEERRVHFKNIKNKKMIYIYKLYWPLYLSYRFIKKLLSNL